MKRVNRRQGQRRVYNLEQLPLPRCYMCGPKWRRLFDVEERLLADIRPESAIYHRPGKTILVFSFEHDVRELVLEELRPGVFAMWSDPRERVVAARKA